MYISSQRRKTVGMDYSHIEYMRNFISIYEFSMYGYCYIFSIKVYITKITYRTYTM